MGDSVIKAFNGESNKKEKEKIGEKFKNSRDESILEKTRKEWQTMLSKNID